MDDLEAMDDELSILKDQLKFQKNISVILTALRILEDDITATKVAKNFTIIQLLWFYYSPI